MPIYEYKCDNCGAVFEMLRSINAGKQEICPDCGESASRIISAAAGFAIKGNPASGATRRSNCGHQSPCCGREVRCDKTPCES